MVVIMSNYRNKIAIGISVASMVTVLLVWPELYLWSKVMRLPEWSKELPLPLFTGMYMSAVCLLPAAFMTNSVVSSRRGLMVVLLVAPIPALVMYSLDHGVNQFLLFNVVFQYIWIIMFGMLIPALTLGSVRWSFCQSN